MSGRFKILAVSIVAPLLIGAGPTPCLLCTQGENETRYSAPEIPLRIEITTPLNFSRIALTGRSGAQITVDPAGAHSLNGDAVPLGGYPVAGYVMLTGNPGRSVRIDIPREVTMQSSTGGQISITDMRTTLGRAPRLGASGRLEFSFGGRLDVKGDMAGRFRGRIPITAHYE